MTQPCSSALGDLLCALRRDAAHDFPDFPVRPRAAVVQLDGDALTDLAQPVIEPGLGVGGFPEPVDGVRVEGPAVSVGPPRHSFKPALDRGSWAGLASFSSPNLKTRVVVHSYR